MKENIVGTGKDQVCEFSKGCLSTEERHEQ